ncbi:ATP-binding protein [Marinomonas ostreistagni]|uniref:ATP-binding protein n=1 Tax=Marinomonas ostreistagni TaxID=359209 RepID=UPI00195060B0|nr:ATP-binding protein [Marinomonas ostreistagni]MBM6552017.1 CHASE domain-containing protein [Marinomonas ostreistagni]
MTRSAKIVLVTALGYFFAGWLGQLFAVPPGYATVIWPASGVAIAACLLSGYRAVLGVFIGSMLVNISITYGNTEQLVFLVPALIALGSSIQTFVSYALVRRFIGFPIEFHNIRHVLYFLLLAGPFGCLVSASVGTSVLLYFDILPDAQAGLNWLSWWLGDSVGVIVTVPWFVVLFRKRFKVYYDHPWRVVSALFIVALTTALISSSTAYFELNKQRQAFNNSAELDSTLLSERVKNSVDILYGMAGYIRGSGQIYDYEFYDYSENLLRRDRAIKALSLNHVVLENERPSYEALMSDMYGRPFQIMQRNADGQLVPAGEHSRYVSVGIIYPSEPNLKALGYDVYSESLRRQTIDQAIRLNAAYPTPAIRLVQDSLAILVFLPVYKGQQLTAMATALFDISDLSERVLGRHRDGTTEVYLVDRRTGQDPYVIAASDNATLVDEALFAKLETQAFPVMARTIIPVGAHHWELIHVSPTRFIEQPWGTHFVLVAGLFVAGLLGWVLSLVFSHAGQIERQVTARTRELSEANAALRDYGEQLRQATESAQEANLAKSRFLANMSHEIRTPLNGLLGSMSLLQEKNLATEQKNLVALALQSGDALLDLVNDILDLSKIEAGELELEYHDFNVQDLLEDVSSLMRVKAQEREVRFFAPQTLLPEVLLEGDRLRLRQVILNLLGNAIKFSEAGDAVSLSARLEADAGQTHLLVAVQDTGIGISEGLQSRLFQRFKQADTSTTRRYGGTGLGLAISKELVEAMGGEIGVESQLGQGSTFWIRLPVTLTKQAPLQLPKAAEALTEIVLISQDDADVPYLQAICVSLNIQWQHLINVNAESLANAQLLLVDQALLAQPDQAQRLRDLAIPIVLLCEQGSTIELDNVVASLYKPVHRRALLNALESAYAQPTVLGASAGVPAEQSHLSKPKVLLVEDNLTNQIVAKGMLALLDVDVDVAQNGAEALEQVQQQRYDLIFMDCQMPVMDGYEATEHVRLLGADSATPATVPIIALSANAMKGDDELCYAAGMNDHVAKPVTKPRLEEVLKQWLAQ